MFLRLYDAKYKFEKDDDVSVDSEVYIFDDLLNFGYTTSADIAIINTLGYYLKRKNMNENLKSAFIDIIYRINCLHKLNLKDNNLSDESDAQSIAELYKDFNFNIEDIKDFECKSILKKIESTPISKDEYISNNLAKTTDDNITYKEITNDNITFYFNDNTCNKYKRHICIFSKANEDDIISELRDLLNQIGNISLNRSSFIKPFSFEMTKVGLHVEAVNSMNILIKILRYLMNSASYRENELFHFDEYKIKQQIEYASIIMDRAYDVINYQINLK